MEKKTILILLLIISALFWTETNEKRIPQFAGPYRIIVKRIGNETDEFQNSLGKMWDRIFFSPPKPKAPQYAWGLHHNVVGVSDNFKMEVRISQRSNNQWKRNAFVFKFDQACSAWLTYAKSVVNFMYKPNERKCPLPAVGTRTIQNATFQPVFPVVPIVPYGYYLFSMVFIRDDDILGVIVAEGEAVPKL